VCETRQVRIVEVEHVPGGSGRDHPRVEPVAERSGGARGGFLAPADGAGEPVEQGDPVAGCEQAGQGEGRD
jgi:hypothetical protein